VHGLWFLSFIVLFIWYTLYTEFVLFDQSESCSNPLLQLLRENRLDEARQSLSQATLIDLSHSALSDFEFHNLALVLQDTTSVVDLNLSHSVCTGKQLADLIFATAKNQTFSGLDVCECNLNDSDIECIAKALEFNETIQLLDLMSNSITDTGAKVLSEVHFAFSCHLLFFFSCFVCRLSSTTIH
jgi:hypothetical protein